MTAVDCGQTTLDRSETADSATYWLQRRNGYCCQYSEQERRALKKHLQPEN